MSHQHHQIHAAITGGRAAEPIRRMAAPVEPLLMSAVECAPFLGMSLRKFHLTRPDLPAPVVIGPRHVRWRRADLIAWVQALATAGEREEPAQLRAGKTAKRINVGAQVVDSVVGSRPPNAETQGGRKVGLPAVPANPNSAVGATA